MEKVRFRLAGDLAALGRAAALKFAGDGAKPAAQDDVHHPLVGCVAVFQRDLFRQDVDPQDGFGRDVLNLVKTGNAMAVQQHHG
jgi:hypothetical protein